MAQSLLKTGKYQFRVFGGAIEHANYQTIKVEPFGDDFIIAPVKGFGDPMKLRLAITTEKPDIILLFTDPRFFIWIFEMEDEIHDMCPIAYNHIWDEEPYPSFNEALYEATDLINCISWKTYSLVQPHFPEKTNYIPHALSKDIFKKLPESEIYEYKKQLIGKENADAFVGLWINRNARRKRPGDLLVAWKQFLEKLQNEQGHKNAILIMHTDPLDNEGPNLYKQIEMLDIVNNVFISKNKIDFQKMNVLHNIADFCINVSCLPAGELIATDNGYRDIQDMKVGDKVLTHNGRFKPITQLFTRQLHNESLYTIKSANNQPIRITGEHPVYAIKKEKVNFLINENISKLKELIEWIKVKDLQVGDYVVYANNIDKANDYHDITHIDLYDFVKNRIDERTKSNTFQFNDNYIWPSTSKCLHASNQNKRFIKIDEDLAYILGLWVADGTTNTANICLNAKTEWDIAKRYIKCVKRSFNKQVSINLCNKLTRLGINIRKSLPHAKMFSALCGKYSHGKYVPHFILNSKNNNLKRAFLEGYVDGDGCILTNKYYPDNPKTTRIRTVSHQLAFNIRTLLTELGYCPKMSYDSNAHGYGNGNIWTIEWRDRKRLNNGSCRSWNIDNKYVVSRIFDIQIEENSYEQVYNFEVKDDNSYGTAGFTTHNCAEGFGLSTLEALYTGTPIIATKTGGLTQQVENPKTNEQYGVGMNPDVRALVGSQTVSFIMEDHVRHDTIMNAIHKLYVLGKSGRKELGNRGQAYAHEAFNIDTLTKTWDKTLEKCILDYKANKNKPRYKMTTL
ncbi:hypothetical protein CMI47_03895 [Candidatus Pacearchaeota archaeon]|nr:hypothetical protein [Candidatus Pacearchaeota archaeon]